MTNLKACPFCRSEKVFNATDHGYPHQTFWVECEECVCKGPRCPNKVDAVHDWNNRHEQAGIISPKNAKNENGIYYRS
jgi:hypothetical protein